MNVPFIAIVDLPLEIAEVAFLFVLAIIAIATIRYIRSLQEQLDEQKRFTKKLNDTVDHMLKIDDDGGIDSNRRSPHKK